jgi:hypothetical protein
MAAPDGPEEREAYAEEQSWSEDDRIDAIEDAADSELMAIAERRLNCRTNEFGERIPHMLSCAPVDSSKVTDSILDAMRVLR